MTDADKVKLCLNIIHNFWGCTSPEDQKAGADAILITLDTVLCHEPKSV